MNNETRYGRIEIAKQAHNFSIGHFTIFSATERENLHGHNLQLVCEVTAPVGDNGLLFDYAILKQLMKQMCDEIDEQVILPTESPYLQIEESDGYIVAIFNGERLPFLPRDVTLLPIRNSSVEEFSWFFLNRIQTHPDLSDAGIIELIVKVSSSPGQFGTARWAAPD
ncbi:MAG: 6-pyruvoyl tetrahydropterin synthase [Gammaproteobacteria bacterium]|nr:6-pyruvoyl tetrahydropterin synthase [Gammaproteobacteria bacterium]RPG25263.1 MAG: 6-pyruvoyl tetrahydropterin synthase [Gammaproteobacteria bacterium TMED50]